MTWHRYVASGLVALGAVGCGSGQSPSLVAGPTDDAQAVRLQKPEIEKVRYSLLDTKPDPLAESTKANVAASIRATVNGVPILDEEVRDASIPLLLDLARTQIPESERAAKQVEIFKQTLQTLIEREILYQDAMSRLSKGPAAKLLDKIKDHADREFDKKVRAMKTRTGVKSDEELKALMRSQGVSLDGMRRQFQREFLVGQYIRSKIESMMDMETGHEQVLEYYRQHPEDFQVLDNVQWLDIFVDAGKFDNRESARQFAASLSVRGHQGEDFVQLSSQYDNGDARYRKGEGYGHRRGEVRPPEAEAALFQMKDGQVGPLIELTNGFHVIKLVHRDHAGQQPFDEKTQTRIREKLRDETSQRELKRLLNELKYKARIEYARSAP